MALKGLLIFRSFFPLSPFYSLTWNLTPVFFQRARCPGASPQSTQDSPTCLTFPPHVLKFQAICQGWLKHQHVPCTHLFISEICRKHVLSTEGRPNGVTRMVVDTGSEFNLWVLIYTVADPSWPVLESCWFFFMTGELWQTEKSNAVGKWCASCLGKHSRTSLDFHK